MGRKASVWLTAFMFRAERVMGRATEECFLRVLKSGVSELFDIRDSAADSQQYADVEKVRRRRDKS